MVRADEAARVAPGLLAETHAAMGAAVLDHFDAAVAVAHHDNRTLADPGLAEIARLRNLDFQRYIGPVILPVEEAVELETIDSGIAIGPDRKSNWLNSSQERASSVPCQTCK